MVNPGTINYSAGSGAVSYTLTASVLNSGCSAIYTFDEDFTLSDGSAPPAGLVSYV